MSGTAKPIATKDNLGYKSEVAKSSLAVEQGDFIKIASGYVDQVWAWDTIEGVSVTQKTYASDNQSSAKEEVTYRPVDANEEFEIEITGGTITQADVDKYYDLDSNQVVDGTSESTSTGQVQLTKNISSTRGRFRIVNA